MHSGDFYHTKPASEQVGTVTWTRKANLVPEGLLEVLSLLADLLLMLSTCNRQAF